MSRLMTLKEVCARVGVCRTTIYNRIAERQFPQPVKVGSKSVRWRSDEIDEYIEQISAARAA